MSDTALTTHPVTRAAVTLQPHALVLVAVAGLAATGGLYLGAQPAGFALGAVAGALAALALILRVIGSLAARRTAGLHGQLAAFISNDASPSFTTNADGEVTHQNRAAFDRFGKRDGQTLTRALTEVFASPGAVIYRLQNRAEAQGAAREDMVTRRGHVRLAVHRIADGAFLWRLEDMVERAPGGRGVESISLPMLTVSKQGTILFMNEAMRRLTGERVKSLDRLFADPPVRPGEEHEIWGAEGPLRTLVAEVEGQGGRKELYFLPAQGEPATPRDPIAFDNLPVAILRLDAKGRLAEANRAARELIGTPGEDATLGSLFEGLGRPVADWLEDAVAGRAENRPEVMRLRAEGEDMFLQVTLSRTVEAGRVGLAAILTDATKLKTLEAQFVQSQKMQAIGQLAGGVAHDFNNLLTAISGHCDLLLLRHDRGDSDFADLTQIAQNANRAAALVGQLLAFSRKQTLRPAIIDLRDAMSDLTHLLNRLVGERISLTLAHDADLRPVRVDRRQLEQVIMNLVVNARDAMPGGGHIGIVTRNLTLGVDLQRDRVAVPAGDYVVIEVRDEGTGIAPDKLDKIFEPFFTTKRPGEGTGLGLSTAYGIVKQSGGYIFCDSVVGEGTCFSLYFPAHEKVEEQAALEPAAARPRDMPRTGQGVVLLVEDEAPVRAFASRALKMRGYTVIEAECAEEALELLEDPGLAVDVFVTDVIMPGMDGPSWVRAALKDRPGTRVVFVSGYSEEALADARDRIPNSIFLPKPFSLSELTATVQRQLH